MREAQLEDCGSGLAPVSEGWFVVNVRDAEWWSSEAVDCSSPASHHKSKRYDDTGNQCARSHAERCSTICHAPEGARGASSDIPAHSRRRLSPRLCETAAVPEDHFGEHVAERFDERYAHQATPDVVGPIVDFVADLAGDGDALELGVGTGRIALPLAQRGVLVHGIDLSEAMVARLRAKPGAERVVVTVGDFATTTIEGTFSVVYLVANTIMNLTTQDEQVACFRNAAAHLEPNGCFVIEVLVPRFSDFRRARDSSRSPWMLRTLASTSTTSFGRA